MTSVSCVPLPFDQALILAAVILGRQWRGESDSVKSIWEQKAQETKANHALKYPDYAFQPRGANEKKRRLNKNKIRLVVQGNAQEQSSPDNSTDLNAEDNEVDWSQLSNQQELPDFTMSYFQNLDLVEPDSLILARQPHANVPQIVFGVPLPLNNSPIAIAQPTALNLAAQRDDDANIPMAMYEMMAAHYDQQIRDEFGLGATPPTTTFGNTGLNSTLAREMDFQRRSRAEDERMTRIDPYNTPSHQHLSLTDRTRSPSTEVDHFNLDNFQQNSDPDWSSSNDFSTVDTSTADDNPFSIFNNPDMSYNLFDTWTPAADSP